MTGHRSGWDAYEQVLAYLSSLPGEGRWVSGPVVRGQCEASPAAVDRALGQLVGSGRVEKMPDHQDGRRNVYRLTYAPLRLVVGHYEVPAQNPAMPDAPLHLSLDVMECLHSAVSHFVPEAKASPYVHDHEAKTVRRRCLECAPTIEAS